MIVWPWSQLNRIEADIQLLKNAVSVLYDFTLEAMKQMAVDLTALTTAVTNQGTVEASAITLLQGLSAQIAALAKQPTVDPAALQSLADSINANAAKLAAAVTANTPAGP